jgi:hypothetical protein
MEFLVIIVVVVVLLFLSLLVLSIFLYFNFFIKNRSKIAQAEIIPIRYLPDKIPIVEETVEERYALSNTDKKRLKMRRINNMFQSKTILVNDIQEASENNNWLFGFFCCCGSRSSSQKPNQVSKHNIINYPIEDCSPSPKRFLSNDRLKKLQSKQITSDSEENESIGSSYEYNPNSPTSFLDIETQRMIRTEQIIIDRKKKRVDKKLSMIQNGSIDVVAVNSGPPPHLIPPGYKLSEVVPKINEESLLLRKVMYLWDGDKKKAEGWFFGLISSRSKLKGCNFNIKYDRLDTKNVFVDGIRNVNLTLDGDNAYGKRWVILLKIEDV